MQELEEVQKAVFRQQFWLFSKVNVDFLRERPTINLDISLIQDNLADPLNAYLLSVPTLAPIETEFNLLPAFVEGDP